MNFPAMKEAKMIGNLKNVDGFANQRGIEKYIAWLDPHTYKNNPQIEIYWVQGLLKRDDVDQRLKKKIAAERGISLDRENEK